MANGFNAKLKDYQIIIISSIVLFISTIILGFIFYTPMLSWAIKSQKALKPGNQMRDFYLKVPLPLDFRVYFFNVTNPTEVQEGQKPILHEVGPYCYDAYKEKIVIRENKNSDTLTYSPYDTYFFNQTRTGNLSHDDYITILNPLVVGIINAVASDKPQFLSTVNKALPAIFKESYSIYLTTRVRDILFDGVKIDCNVKEFSATAVCSQFKGQPAMREGKKNIFYFSLFQARNGTIPQQITVHKGIQNGEDIGQVVAINNYTELQIWPQPECNKFHGTDGWIFPSFLHGDIDVVAADLCRNFRAKYIEDVKFHGVKVKRYYADLAALSEGEESCYCPKPNRCLPKGIIDLTKCLKVPILCTLPHFLRVDEKVLEQVDGLHPDIEKHIIEILFEPTTGSPVYGQRRVQFNLELKPIPKVGIMQTVPEAIHPILWIEEGVELTGFLLEKVITVTTLLKMLQAGRYVCLVIWLELFAYGCYQGYKDWKLTKVGPVENPTDNQNEDPEQNGHTPQDIETIYNNLNLNNLKHD